MGHMLAEYVRDSFEWLHLIEQSESQHGIDQPLNVIGSGKAREKTQKEPNVFIFHRKNHHKPHVMPYTVNALTYQYRTASRLRYNTRPYYSSASYHSNGEELFEYFEELEEQKLDITGLYAWQKGMFLLGFPKP